MIKTRFAASLVFAIAAMPALAADDTKSPTDSSRPSTTASSTQNQGRQITLTGKIVDLHEYFTGQKDSSGKYDSGSKSDSSIKSDSTRPGTGATDTTRPGTNDQPRPDSTTRPDSSATRPGASSTDTSSAKSGMKSQQQYMVLTNPAIGTSTGATGADATGARAGSVNVTSSDVVILCFAEAPSVFAVPRSDDRPSTTPGSDRPSATPGTDRPSPTQGTDRPATPGTTTTDRTNTGVGSSADHKDHGQWKDKQVQVTGTMYEKGGLKFLLVSRVSSGSDAAGSSTRPSTGTGTDRKIDDKNDKNDNK